MKEQKRTTGEPSLLVDRREAAGMCRISVDHFLRLVESGAAPSPVRLGRAVRWQRAALEGWIQAGCPRQRGGRS